MPLVQGLRVCIGARGRQHLASRLGSQPLPASRVPPAGEQLLAPTPLMGLPPPEHEHHHATQAEEQQDVGVEGGEVGGVKGGQVNATLQGRGPREVVDRGERWAGDRARASAPTAAVEHQGRSSGRSRGIAS